MSHVMHVVAIPLMFPAGIAPGAGGDYNQLLIARNGAGQPVLRGTALAGALRHATALREIDGPVLAERYFGKALTQDDGQESPLTVSDCVLQIGERPTLSRTHHLRNRHTGAVADGGLFTIELCPPGTTTTARLWLDDSEDDPGEAAQFLWHLVTYLNQGITLGGNAARGVGLAQVDGEVVYRRYNLEALDDHAEWLNDRRSWQLGP